jgi:hypothetical protein
MSKMFEFSCKSICKASNVKNNENVDLLNLDDLCKAWIRSIRPYGQ